MHCKLSQIRILLALCVALPACGFSDLNTGKSSQDANKPAPSVGAPNAPIPASEPTLPTVAQLSEADGGPYYMGRFDTSDANGPKFAWGGTSIFARFTGTGISINLDELDNQTVYSGTSEGNQYDVVVDGGAPTLLTPGFGSGAYVLAAALSEGAHSVVVTKRTEALVGTAQFRGFTVQGQPLAAPQTLPVDRRIEIIGDSISAGYGVLGTDANCSYSPATQSETLAYGYLAAKTLQAEVHVNAWSGKGVYRNNDNTTTQTMSQLWQLSLPADANTAWNFSDWQPQVVVINLGTNDFYSGVPDATLFENAYAALIKQVRTNYPDALIFCALGPMLSDAYPVGQMALSTARTDVQAVVQGAGDPNVSFIEFPAQSGTVGCDSHPVTTKQVAMAAQLASAIAAKTGWK